MYLLNQFPCPHPDLGRGNDKEFWEMTSCSGTEILGTTLEDDTSLPVTGNSNSGSPASAKVLSETRCCHRTAYLTIVQEGLLWKTGLYIWLVLG
jgi:hypothetical protein